MKLKNLLLTAAILMIATAFVIAQPVKTNGNLSVKGAFLVNEKGEQIVLRGVSYGWHNWWPRFYNKESVKWLSDDWKCTVVRAAMGVGPRGSYIDRKEWSKERIEAVVKGAIESGIYVIIDWHSHEIHTEEAKLFFAEMAEKYGKYPNVIYEIFNEPVKDSWDTVKDYSIMEASGNGPIDYESWNTWIDWMEKNKISWVTWSIADKNETCSMLKTSAQDTGNWSENDVKESGIKTREKLREFAKKKQYTSL